MSKHDDRIAFFPSPRHLIGGLVDFINDQIYSASYYCPLNCSILGKNHRSNPQKI